MLPFHCFTENEIIKRFSIFRETAALAHSLPPLDSNVGLPASSMSDTTLFRTAKHQYDWDEAKSVHIATALLLRVQPSFQ